MKTVTLPEELVTKVIDQLRYMSMLYNWDYPDTLASEIQFGHEGVDEHDGHRCRICDKLVGGDVEHKCWMSEGV